MGNAHCICNTSKKLSVGYSTPALLLWVSEGVHGFLFDDGD